MLLEEDVDALRAVDLADPRQLAPCKIPDLDGCLQFWCSDQVARAKITV